MAKPNKNSRYTSNRLPIVAVYHDSAPYPKLFLALQEAQGYRDFLYPGNCPKLVFISKRELDSMLKNGLKTMELLKEFISSMERVSLLLEKTGHIANANAEPLPHRDSK